MPTPRTQEELRRELDEQLAALRASAEGYDKGNNWESKRLVTCVAILVYDGGRGVSLLRQLGMKDQLRFLSVFREWNPRNLASYIPLVMISGDIGYVPKLGNGPPIPPRTLRFKEWWREVIFADQKQNKLTRERLVLSLRNQDGGSHVDQELTDDVYIGVSRENSAAWMIERDGVSTPVDPGPHLASMRHIAWEVEQAIAGLNWT